VAPLLLNAAGLVVAEGSVGAHVFEVARSLGVPSVVGVDVPEGFDGALAAVDGEAGTVWVLAEGDVTASRWGA
jgi:phosphohistidine swiveling domain-containing protein